MPGNRLLFTGFRSCSPATTVVDQLPLLLTSFPVVRSLGCGGGLGLIFLGELNQFVKNLWLEDGDFAQHLAIQIDACQAQAMHELAVGQSASSNSGGDSDNPQAPHISLFQAAMGACEDACSDDGFFDCSVQLVAAHYVSACFAEETFLDSTAGGTFTHSHGSFDLTLNLERPQRVRSGAN